MRWRQGGLTPVYMTKDEVYQVTLSLWNTSYIVAPGHALRISIASSNYPRFDINRNNGILLANQTSADVNVTATNTIYHSAKYPSYVSLPVVKKFQLPQVHDIKEQFQKAYPQLDVEKVIERKYCFFSFMDVFISSDWSLSFSCSEFPVHMKKMAMHV
jgi:hypothetical protein